MKFSRLVASAFLFFGLGLLGCGPDVDSQDQASCSGGACSEPTMASDPSALGESCGGVICGKGTYCCNPSCGVCVPYGMSCPQVSC